MRCLLWFLFCGGALLSGLLAIVSRAAGDTTHRHHPSGSIRLGIGANERMPDACVSLPTVAQEAADESLTPKGCNVKAPRTTDDAVEAMSQHGRGAELEETERKAIDRTTLGLSAACGLSLAQSQAVHERIERRLTSLLADAGTSDTDSEAWKQHTADQVEQLHWEARGLLDQYQAEKLDGWLVDHDLGQGVFSAVGQFGTDVTSDESSSMR